MKRVGMAALLFGALAIAACGDEDYDPQGTAASTAGTRASQTSTSQAAQTAGLDAGFGKSGIAQLPISVAEHDRFMAVALGNDGAIYAAGFVSQAGDHAMALAKFSSAGAADLSFGKGGVAIVNVAAGGKTAEVARSISITSGGKILIAGPVEHDTSATGDAAKDTDIAVLRFDASGKLDSSFGKEGIARIDLGAGKATSATAFVGDTSWGLGAMAGEKVAVFGSRLAGEDRNDTDFVLVGLTSAGALDSGFGKAGTLVVDVSRVSDNPRTLLVQKDGKIVATGYSTIEGVVQPVILRTSATGELDSAFGTNGVATGKVLDGVAESYAVALQGDSYISAGYGRGADATEKVDMIVGRWTPVGQRDIAFGREGVARLDLAKDDDRARNVAVLPDGRILTIGSGKLTAANVDALAVLWRKDGEIESSFGTSGYILSDLGGPTDAWFGVAVSPDGKFAIIAGYKGTDAASGGNDDAFLAKVNL